MRDFPTFLVFGLFREDIEILKFILNKCTLHHNVNKVNKDLWIHIWLGIGSTSYVLSKLSSKFE